MYDNVELNKRSILKSFLSGSTGKFALLVLLVLISFPLICMPAAADSASASGLNVAMALSSGDDWDDCLVLTYSGTVSGKTASSWSWSFDDDDTATGSSGTHTYDETGTYDVVLVVTYSDSTTEQIATDIAIEEPTLDASADITVDDDDLKITYESTTDGAVSWEWDFDDGDTSTSESGSHYYDDYGDYTVTLTVTSEDGSTDTYTEDITLDESPSAYFTVDVDSGSSPLTVEFTDGSEENSYTGADIVEWVWDFDYDDETATFDDDDSSADTEFTFEEEGTYTVTLTVTDEDGEENSYEMDIVVDDDSAPTADYYIDDDCDTSGTAPLTIQFYDDSEEAEDTGAELTSWLWKFYDEDDSLYLYSYSENPELEFEDEGVYTLVYTVTDADGVSDSITEEDLIEVYSGLSVTFYGSPTSGTTPFTVYFYATDGAYNEYDIETYYWYFGDGSTSSESDTSTSHTYTTAGTYDVKLKVTDEEGNTYTCTESDYITVSTVATSAATSSKTYAVTESATSVETEEADLGSSTSSGTTIFGIPGTEYFRTEMSRFYNFYEEYTSLLAGMFGMG